jgi:ADP-heptose:LPS heptosyltransferase
MELAEVGKLYYIINPPATKKKKRKWKQEVWYKVACIIFMTYIKLLLNISG